MRLGGRLAAAIEILGEVERRHRPVGEALKDWGLSHRFAGSGDRAAIGNIVYDALRWRLSSGWLAGSDEPRGWVLATVCRRWGLGTAALAGHLAEDPHSPAAMTATEVERLDAADLAAAPPHVQADLPEWVAAKFAAVFGDDWVAEGAALALRPPLDVRVNPLKADRAKVEKALAKYGATPTRYAPLGLRIAATSGEGRHPNVQVEAAFRKGWFEVQDEGSQIAAAAVAAGRGEQVLDICAGAGGKTLALAAAMANKGQLFATDRDPMRLAPIYERLKRAGTRNVQVRDPDSSLDPLAGRMDAVLVDAPCTGTGVWRRRPDAKWRLSERGVAERTAGQDAVLADAARCVAPGGTLVYVTCTLLPEENGERLAAFLARTPGFSVVAPAQVIATAGLATELTEAALLTDTGFVLSPRRTGTDGFFVASLRRQ